jgi:uncharacterized protein (DUF2267 family)
VDTAKRNRARSLTAKRSVKEMDDRQFFQKVAERAVLSIEEAADLTRATLQTLADRLSNGEARHLSEQLPDGLREYLPARERIERFDLNDLLRRVSKHTGLNAKETEAGVRAVLVTLGKAVKPEVFAHAMAQLPGEFRAMAGQPA